MSVQNLALSEPTDVFAAAEDEAVAVMFLCRLRGHLPAEVHHAISTSVLAELDALAKCGWKLSVSEMFGRPAAPSAYATGFAHDVDFVGVFEAPGLTEAMRGTVSLGHAGWDRICTTEWLIGPREFRPVVPSRADEDRPWGFLALWQWNESWQAATPEERREYDAECDEAFISDVSSGIAIAGRHRLDWSTGWHHLGIWESPSVELVDEAMQIHERVADFKFTTSRHYVGPRHPLERLLERSYD